MARNRHTTHFFFRSVPMAKFELLLCTETAFECMLELGYLGKVEFIKPYINTNEQPVFEHTVKRCAELLKAIEFVEAQIEELEMNFVYYPDVGEEYPPAFNDLNKYEDVLYGAAREVREILFNLEDLYRQREYNEERTEALRMAEEFLQNRPPDSPDSVTMNITQTDNQDPRDQKLAVILGTILTEKFFTFQRTLFRTVRYNYYIKGYQIQVTRFEPLQSAQVERRTVFVLCYSGKNLGERLLKICNAFRCRIFDCPMSVILCKRQLIKVREEVIALDEIIKRVNDQRKRIVGFLASDIYIWKYNTKKIMAIYVELNKMTMVQPASQVKYLTCLCWVPVESVFDVRQALLRGSIKGTKQNPLQNIFPPMLSNIELDAKEMPPTYFNVNSFTSGFQALINAYGLANYRELNPAPYTVITFPFLFAVMFGDVGHGLIMMLFALVLIVKNTAYQQAEMMRKKQNEIAKIMFGGRHIIFLMGLFSIYTGLIYNDFFSKSLNIFGSHWYVDPKAWDKSTYDLNPESAANYQGDPYVFGMDPVWKISGDTAIITFNSIKMKLAIVLGVFHMIFGLLLSAANHIHFESYIDLVLITIPQIIIFSSLFFYLIILIFFKWINYGGHLKTPYNTACAPSILISFIDMFLMKQSVTPFENCEATMYDGQLVVQKVLLFMAFCCVPILLVGKPIYFHILQWKIRKQKDKEKRKRLSEKTRLSVRKSLLNHISIEGESRHSRRRSTTASVMSDPQEEFDMMEVWIHSGIHAIDSVLGAISHTASYLRLWALSLAHEQLSHVLWMMVLKRGFGNEFYYSVILFLAFAVWAGLTVAILVTMEALSAFLHTLRLHWVEFQSKFYTGNGEAFMPFVFEPPNKYL